MAIAKNRRVSVVGGASALVLIAAAAHAGTVAVGGSATSGSTPFTASLGTGNIAFITDYGVETYCETLDASGFVTRGAPTPGIIGSFSDVVLEDCRFTQFEIPATINIASGTITALDGTSSPDVEIEVMGATFATTNPSPPCTFTMSGVLYGEGIPGSNGTPAPDGAIDMTPAVFSGATPVSGFGLDISVGGSGSTCLGEVVDGDRAGNWWVDGKNTPATTTIKPRILLSTGGAGDITF